MIEVYLDHITMQFNISIRAQYINSDRYPEEFLDYINEVTLYINEHIGKPYHQYTPIIINDTIKQITKSYSNKYPNFILIHPRNCI